MKAENPKKEFKIGHACAAICGLFCGTCPSFLGGRCGGCLSESCDCDCINGFKDCASEMGVTRCFECTHFPCEKLEDFSTRHIVNGIAHHEKVIEDLVKMKTQGVDAWLSGKVAENTCAACGVIVPWCERKCTCGKPAEQRIS